MKTLIVYGNCQASVIARLMARDPGIAASYRVLFTRSYVTPKSEKPPTAQEYAACSLLCEQIDANPIRSREPFAPDCAVVRFPSVDTNLLWPLYAHNPYYMPEASDPESLRFPFGDRILSRCLDEGMSVEETIAYYDSSWDAYAPNFTRISELERSRIAKREGGSDVRIADLALDELLTKPLFSSPSHPLPEMLHRLAARIVAACAKFDPAFADVDIEATARANPELPSDYGDMELPVHPRVAEALGLQWFDPAKRYAQVDGTYRTHDEYVAEFVAYSAEQRKQHAGGPVVGRIESTGYLPEMLGPIAAVGRVSGMHLGSFMSASASFEIEALERVQTVTVRGFVPVFHRSAVTLSAAIGTCRTELVDIAPESMFELKCQVDLEPGSRHRVDLGCSQWFNLFERGESEDNRDLSVLLLSIEASS